jgi:starch phosphorylase
VQSCGADTPLVAYFSSEFAVDERLPIYAGGLGVLAGDHLKSAAELGVPLVAVGLLYREGYFAQSLDEHGWQRESYPASDPADLPLAPTGAEVAVTLAGEEVRARVWRYDVGRIPLYLLDTDVEGNSPAGRAVTATLYGGDREQRLRQELVLGVGGVRALAALGTRPSVFHMNEGHAALLGLERLRVEVARGMSFDEALERVRASTVFTTHTPVPAGHDVFDLPLAERYLGSFAGALGVSWTELATLAAERADDPFFGMTPLALRTAEWVNGVSLVHGRVSRAMWRDLWPGRREEDVPIGHVTNGVHAGTWLSRPLAELLRSAGVRPEQPPAREGWEQARSLDGRALWQVHRSCKERLLEHVAGSTGAELDPEALTVGFARRFATYKRADLLFADEERLARLLGDRERPLQILVAGKAHPADDAGKVLLQRIVAFARDARANRRVAVLENYDLAVARLLVQGCDVWLNTPLRPLEASGTSGMKAGMNGVLNVSVLDGWWYEGFSPDLGWAIGGRDPHAEQHDDGRLLLELLEQEVLPRFHDRDPEGLPVSWVQMMRASIAELGARFNSNRMVSEYVEQLYLPAHRGALRAAA